MLYARYVVIVLIISLSWASQTLRENNCTMHTFAVIEPFHFPSNKLLLFILLKEKEKCVSLLLKKFVIVHIPHKSTPVCKHHPQVRHAYSHALFNASCFSS